MHTEETDIIEVGDALVLHQDQAVHKAQDQAVHKVQDLVAHKAHNQTVLKIQEAVQIAHVVSHKVGLDFNC